MKDILYEKIRFYLFQYLYYLFEVDKLLIQILLGGFSTTAM